VYVDALAAPEADPTEARRPGTEPAEARRDTSRERRRVPVHLGVSGGVSMSSRNWTQLMESCWAKVTLERAPRSGALAATWGVWGPFASIIFAAA
jgi:hypothetical protein